MILPQTYIFICNSTAKLMWSEASKCTALQGKGKEVSWQPFQNQCGLFCFACATWRCHGGRVKQLPVNPYHWRRGRSLGLVEGAQHHISMTVPASIFVYQPLVPPQSVCLALEGILHPLILETSKSGYTSFSIAKNLWAPENLRIINVYKVGSSTNQSVDWSS